MVLHVENYFVVVKNILINSSSTGERLATLYLMYALYYKQPAKDFCKFRFTLADWINVRPFCQILHNDLQYQQGRSIFWRLWYGDAFRFVESDVDYYPDITATNRVDDGTTDGFYKINGAILNRIKDWQGDGIMGALETLEVGYDEMREHLASVDGVSYAPSHSFKEVMTAVDNIRKLFANNQVINILKRNKAGPSNAMHDSDSDIDDENEDECDASLSSMDSELDEPTSGNGPAENIDSDIGSRRYEIKRKALGQMADGMLRFRSCMNQTNQKGEFELDRSIKTDIDENYTQTDAELIVDTSVAASNDEISANGQVFNVTANGDIVINHRKKVFNRHSKLYISSARKQMQSYSE